MSTLNKTPLALGHPASLELFTLNDEVVFRIPDGVGGVLPDTRSDDAWPAGAEVQVQYSVNGEDFYEFGSGDVLYVSLTSRGVLEIAGVKYLKFIVLDIGAAVDELLEVRLSKADEGRGGPLGARTVGTGPAGADGDGFADGDYGDIVISGSVSVLSIDSSVITTAARTVVSQTTVALMLSTMSGLKGPGGTVVDNAVIRFDGTGGLTGQTSYLIVDDDGKLTSKINSGACDVTVPLVAWIHQDADRTLTSTTSSQKIFDQTANGAVTLPTGRYRFKGTVYVTGLSSTSGNFALSPLGAGTATCTKWSWHAFGADNNSPLNGNTCGTSFTDTSTSGTNVVSATVGTGAQVFVEGYVEITAGGTMIPSIALVTAAAGTLKAGSKWEFERVGDTGVSYVGAWT